MVQTFANLNKLTFMAFVLQHIFITRTRPSSTITELINRTKEAVRNLDKQSYSRVKKIFMGGTITEPLENNESINAGNGVLDTDSVGEDSIVSKFVNIF